MDYTYLTKEDQKEMAETRALGLEQEHYSNMLALQAADKLAESLPDADEKAAAQEQAAQLTKNLVIIESAHGEALKEIGALDTAAGETVSPKG